uniref:Uncharacterized protein n=1 Tax=Trichobilharzia regenti TaxID=157069 RepID=A0AA85KAH6_TRIRE|nr:unnamed protein product [Trichobilharzia regenti]
MEMPKNFTTKSIIWSEYDDEEEDDEGDGCEDDGGGGGGGGEADAKGDHYPAMDYKGCDNNQSLPPGGESKLQFISSNDNFVSDNNIGDNVNNNNNNNNKDRGYTHVSVEISDVSAAKSQSLSSSLNEVKQCISRPSINFTGLKTDDRQSSDEMDSTSSTKVSKSETCDLETAF